MADRKFIYKNTPFDEGEIYYKWERSRIDNNKNVISVTTGATGSGKSLSDLRRAELSYQKRFNKEFPIEQCCFSIAELMRVITKGNLKKGDIVILEEAGFNAGSQDWQNKTTKMFNYLLQTFRSMNICLYMNLPVLSMLARQARQLVHIHFETNGIDFTNKTVKLKPLVHQLNQQTGKSYWKFMRINYKHRVKKVQRMSLGLASALLRQRYDAKKLKFLTEMTGEFTRELEEKERVKLQKMARDDLTEKQREVYYMLESGMGAYHIADAKKMALQSVYDCIRAMKKKGYVVDPKKNPNYKPYNTKQKQNN